MINIEILKVNKFSNEVFEFISKNDGLINYANDDRVVEQRYVATYQGETIGLVTIESLKAHRGIVASETFKNYKVIQVVTNPFYRNQGIARKVINFALTENKSFSFFAFTKTSNTFNKIANEFNISNIDTVEKSFAFN
jgi:GNAT superfamily N-acetyltransferase